PFEHLDRRRARAVAQPERHLRELRSVRGPRARRLRDAEGDLEAHAALAQEEDARRRSPDFLRALDLRLVGGAEADGSPFSPGPVDLRTVDETRSRSSVTYSASLSLAVYPSCFTLGSS